jgi:hypothetical protein
MIEKVYDSFYVDARVMARGRIRAATIEEAKEKGHEYHMLHDLRF